MNAPTDEQIDAAYREVWGVPGEHKTRLHRFAHAIVAAVSKPRDGWCAACGMPPDMHREGCEKIRRS